MTRNGWIIYNGHLPGKKFLDFVQWLQEAASKRGITTKIIKNNHLLTRLNSNGGGLVSKMGASRPDFVLFGDKDLPLARQLEEMNIPVFNSSRSIEISDNKIDSYQVFSRQRLPIPETIVAPKIFPDTMEMDTESFNQIGDILGFPLVMKEAYGSFGKQVYLVRNQQELIEQVKEIKDRPFLFQKFIQTSYGKDIRLNVVGNQVVAAMLRTAKDDFRANVTAGASMQAYQPTKQEEDLAISATKAIGADYAGVDLLFGENNQPVICEINSNAHIRNIFDCTGINVADYIIEDVISKLERRERS